MTFELENIVPWGRSFNEYVAMFALSDIDLEKRILGCGDGPAAFNAALTRQGGQVLSVDPLYRHSAPEIRRRIDKTRDEVLEQTRKNREQFIWSTVSSVEELGQLRKSAMEEFLADYPAGRTEARYLDGELPRLPFANGEFDLALCSHLLFLYSEQLSAEFHIVAIQELCRVARTVRIFPLLEFGARPSRHLNQILSLLSNLGYALDIVPVAYELQRGGNQMLTVEKTVPCA